MDYSEKRKPRNTYHLERILIVDDEIDFIATVRRHLKREGFDPDFALNGESACLKMMAVGNNKRFYDLVITDVVMPKMDGISLLKWIHRTYPKTSVMVVSEFMDRARLEAEIRPEMDITSSKPITPDSMMQLIDSICEKRTKRFGKNGMTAMQKRAGMP